MKIEPGSGAGGGPNGGPAGLPGKAGAPRGAQRLDVVLVLKRSLDVIGRNLGGIVPAGLALVAAPGIVSRMLAGGGEWDTLAVILRCICAMLYVALVGWGSVALLRGRAMPARVFVVEGLARSTPGLQVALLAGAAVFLGLILHLFSQHGTLAGWALDSLLFTAALLGVCVALPVVPVAVVERLGPMAALRRAAALTDGNRNRILALALIVALALAPAAALLAGVAWPAGVGSLVAALFEFVAWTLVATVPAVAYVGLRGAA